MLKKVGNQDYILKLFNNQNNLKHLKYYKYFFLSDIRIFNRIYGLFINDTNNSLVDNSFNYKKVDVGLKNFSLFTTENFLTKGYDLNTKCAYLDHFSLLNRFSHRRKIPALAQLSSLNLELENYLKFKNFTYYFYKLHFYFIFKYRKSYKNSLFIFRRYLASSTQSNNLLGSSYVNYINSSFFFKSFFGRIRLKHHRGLKYIKKKKKLKLLSNLIDLSLLNKSYYLTYSLRKHFIKKSPKIQFNLSNKLFNQKKYSLQLNNSKTLLLLKQELLKNYRLLYVLNFKNYLTEKVRKRRYNPDFKSKNFNKYFFGLRFPLNYVQSQKLISVRSGHLIKYKKNKWSKNRRKKKLKLRVYKPSILFSQKAPDRGLFFGLLVDYALQFLKYNLNFVQLFSSYFLFDRKRHDSRIYKQLFTYKQSITIKLLTALYYEFSSAIYFFDIFRDKIFFKNLHERKLYLVVSNSFLISFFLLKLFLIRTCFSHAISFNFFLYFFSKILIKQGIENIINLYVGQQFYSKVLMLNYGSNFKNLNLLEGLKGNIKYFDYSYKKHYSALLVGGNSGYNNLAYFFLEKTVLKNNFNKLPKFFKMVQSKYYLKLLNYTPIYFSRNNYLKSIFKYKYPWKPKITTLKENFKINNNLYLLDQKQYKNKLFWYKNMLLDNQTEFNIDSKKKQSNFFNLYQKFGLNFFSQNLHLSNTFNQENIEDLKQNYFHYLKLKNGLLSLKGLNLANSQLKLFEYFKNFDFIKNIASNKINYREVQGSYFNYNLVARSRANNILANNKRINKNLDNVGYLENLQELKLHNVQNFSLRSFLKQTRRFKLGPLNNQVKLGVLLKPLTNFGGFSNPINSQYVGYPVYSLPRYDMRLKKSYSKSKQRYLFRQQKKLGKKVKFIRNFVSEKNFKKQFLKFLNKGEYEGIYNRLAANFNIAGDCKYIGRGLFGSLRRLNNVFIREHFNNKFKLKIKEPIENYSSKELHFRKQINYNEYFLGLRNNFLKKIKKYNVKFSNNYNNEYSLGRRNIENKNFNFYLANGVSKPLDNLYINSSYYSNYNTRFSEQLPDFQKYVSPSNRLRTFILGKKTFNFKARYSFKRYKYVKPYFFNFFFLFFFRFLTLKQTCTTHYLYINKNWSSFAFSQQIQGRYFLD